MRFLITNSRSRNARAVMVLITLSLSLLASARCGARTSLPEPTDTVEHPLTSVATTPTVPQVPVSTATSPPQPLGTYLNPNLNLAPGEYITYLDYYEIGQEQRAALYVVSLPDGEEVRIVKDVHTAALSPDARSLVLVAPDAIYLYRQEPGDTEAHQTIRIEFPPGNTDCYIPVWSPDSTHLLLRCEKPYGSDGTTLLVTGDSVLELPQAKDCWYFSWSPDGTEFAAECSSPNTEVKFFDLQGEILFVLPGCAEKGFICNSPAWSRVGSLMLFFKGEGTIGGPLEDFEGYYLADLSCIETSSGCIRPSFQPIVRGDHASWSPINLEYAIDENDINTVSIYNVSTGERREVSQYPKRQSTSSMEWSREGRWLVFHVNNTLYGFDLEMNELRILRGIPKTIYINGSCTRSE